MLDYANQNVILNKVARMNLLEIKLIKI